MTQPDMLMDRQKPQPRAIASLRTWLVTLLIYCSVIGCLENSGRRGGFRPSVIDAIGRSELWYFWRQRVYGNDGKVVVLVGTSRMTSDVSLDALKACLPGHRVVQLGLNGTKSPIGVLQDLAADTSFVGLVICEIDTPLLEGIQWDAQRAYVHYRPTNASQYFNAIGRAWAEDHLVVLHPAHTLRSVFAQQCQSEPSRTGLGHADVQSRATVKLQKPTEC